MIKKVKNRTIMLWLIICYTAILSAKCEGIIKADLIVNFAKQFRAPQPFALFYNVSKETKIKFIKSMSKEDFSLDWIGEVKYTEMFLLIIIENNEHLG